MISLVWAAGCVVVGSVLLLLACVTVPPLRRRRRPAPQPVVTPQLGDDEFPTERIPLIEAEPPRRVLRADELLWHKGAGDDDGVITLGLLPEPGDQLGVLMDVDGDAVGVRLDRREVQGLRDALTNHLVATAKPVRS